MVHQVGFIGLGKMGKNIVLHLLDNGVYVVAYNRTREVTESFVKEEHSGKLIPTYDLKDFVKHLQSPRVIWLMVPNGKPVDEILTQLIAAGITMGDTIIDGGNTYYKDTVTRASSLGEKGIQFIDCGTSGGVTGARSGACLMLGGDSATVEGLDWAWNAVAVSAGWKYMGPSGAGHFVKMVHNSIEYGEIKALGEGFEILAKGPYHINLAEVAATWQNGSIIRGYLVELLSQELAKDPALTGFTGRVGGGETGGWALAAAREFGVEAGVLQAALAGRKRSLTNPTLSTKVVSALRRAYGGHKEAP